MEHQLVAAGPDNIKPITLQMCSGKMIKRLTYMFRASISLGYVPKALRACKVVFIPKPGKPDYTNPKAYRPITLTSCIFKVLERIVLQELETTDMAANPLNQNQHAFRKGSSCDSALSDMVNDIEKSIHRDEYLSLIHI